MRETKTEIIVVGAGPAGLMAAITAAREGREVILLEKGQKAGRKLLVSGSGRCNLTHSGDIDDFLAHYGENGRFLRPAFRTFDNKTLIRFFEERGLRLVEYENGKLFPETQLASDVLKVLLAEADSLGVRIRCRQGVREVRSIKSGFSVTTDTDVFSADRVIMAAGGASYPATGSEGDGFVLMAGFGHRIVEIGPALTSIIAEDWRLSACSGISLSEREIRVRRGGKIAARGRGDVLFTHHGLSGPGILDLSRSIRPGDLVSFPFSDFGHPAALDAEIVRLCAEAGSKTVRNSLAGLGVPERLLHLILDLCAVPADLKAAGLDRARRKSCVAALTEYPVIVARLGGWEEARATRGGVCLEEIDPKRMESRIVSGLFAAGETLDLDGDTGGYNLQMAFSTGYLAGLSASGL